ncbi:hypothetical protein ASPNIDRAFT_39363 [Aspergillus niger ATCC 1015]|uniref:Uncharacterized protein n=1 Tax=Aspergillus niger (strain ATCC 1015 / CBS 113.46 / FGSC A1144 / LSHB Ac4 / NCTC 3858a / NRRL 328 / USDA 3528.7) TaxID=380704 RepID=G3YB78_ASPNA|nr:hypothetical protein ASPNIDRAFT_39363 [Aspergillus niger ATCC 1015]
MFRMLPWIMTLLLLPLFLATRVQAFNTVHTNCTLPPEHTNFVTAPNTRGTLQILWSSLFTILACTWTVLHLNVPEYQPKPEIKNFKRWLDWMVKKYQHPTKWFLLTVLAPEVPLAKYWDDQVRAHSLFHHYEDFFVKKNWTRTHVLFANMGGFALRYATNDEDKSDPDNDKASTENQDSNPPGTASSVEDEASPQEGSSTLKQSTLVFSNAKATQETQPTLSENPAKKFEGVYYLTATDAFKLLCSTKTSIPGLANVSLEEINDRSKTDVFMRLLAVGQILWVVIQIISRAIYGLAVTQLEVTVVAFAVCAVGMYIVNQGKPKGVNVPILLEYPGSQEKLQSELKDARFPDDEGVHKKWKFYKCKYCSSQNGKSRSQQNTNSTNRASSENDEGNDGGDETKSSNKGDMLTDIAMFIGSMVFGGIHLIAWDFQFPTVVERYLWWAAALWCTACVVACTLLVLTLFGLDDIEEALTRFLHGFDHSAPGDTRSENPVDGEPDPSSEKTPNQESERSTSPPLNANEDVEHQAPRSHCQKSIREKAIFVLRRFFHFLRPLVNALFYFVAILLIPCAIAYIVARLFIVVEMFRTLAFLPPDAYVATWSSEIPNIG